MTRICLILAWFTIIRIFIFIFVGNFFYNNIIKYMARHSRSRSRSTSPHSKRRRHSHRREKPRSRSRDRGKDQSNSERSQSKNAEKNNSLKGTSRNGEKDSEKITEKSKDIPQVVTPNQLEQEEKIRLRRERVELWRREREAAKKAEEE